MINKKYEKMEKVELKMELSEGAYHPEYNHVGDSGFDVFSMEDVIIAPGETKLIRTGIKLAIPEGYEIQVRPRSGISKNTNLRIPNSPGTVDSGYKGDVGVLLHNISKDYYWEGDNIKRLNKNEHIVEINEKGNKDGYYHIKKGDKIAQFVLVKIEKAEFKLVDDVRKYGKNRKSCFGLSGMRKE